MSAPVERPRASIARDSPIAGVRAKECSRATRWARTSSVGSASPAASSRSSNHLPSRPSSRRRAERGRRRGRGHPRSVGGERPCHADRPAESGSQAREIQAVMSWQSVRATRGNIVGDNSVRRPLRDLRFGRTRLLRALIGRLRPARRTKSRPRVRPRPGRIRGADARRRRGVDSADVRLR